MLKSMVHVTARVRDEAARLRTRAAHALRQLVAQPRTWLLRIGWTLGLPSDRRGAG